MEVSNNIPAPSETRGRDGNNPEYYLANEIYELPVGSSVWYPDTYDRSRIISRFHHINYGAGIKEEEYRKFVSKKEQKGEEQGFRIWRIQ